MEEMKDPTQWTDKEELDFHTDFFDNLDNSVLHVIMILDKYNINNSRINRIGIYARNKTVELFKEYRDKKVSFSNSLIVRVVTTYFAEVCMIAMKQLQEYLKNNISLIKKKSSLDDYNRLADAICEFELEKDIEVAVTEYIFFMSHANSSFNIKETVNRVNEELKKLGYNKTVEYIDPDNQDNKPKKVKKSS